VTTATLNPTLLQFLDEDGSRRLGLVTADDEICAIQATDSVYGFGFRAVAERAALADLATEFRSDETFSLSSLNERQALLPAIDHPVVSARHLVWALGRDGQITRIQSTSTMQTTVGAVTVAWASHYLIADNQSAHLVGCSLSHMAGGEFVCGYGLWLNGEPDADAVVETTSWLADEDRRQKPATKASYVSNAQALDTALAEVNGQVRRGDVLTLVSPIAEIANPSGANTQVESRLGAHTWSWVSYG
jgi:hypothetical protein